MQFWGRYISLLLLFFIIMVKLRAQTLWDSRDYHGDLSQVSGGENLPCVGLKQGVILSTPQGLRGLVRVSRKTAPGFLHHESTWQRAEEGRKFTDQP